MPTAFHRHAHHYPPTRPPARLLTDSPRIDFACRAALSLATVAAD